MARTVETKSGTVLIANHHTAAIMLPRCGNVGMNISPIVFNPGVVTSLDKDEWDERKKMVAVQAYLDTGLLSVVRSADAEKTVAVTEVTTSNPEIPENLQTEEEQRLSANPDASPIKASVRKSNVTQVPVG